MTLSRFDLPPSKLYVLQLQKNYQSVKTDGRKVEGRAFPWFQKFTIPLPISNPQPTRRNVPRTAGGRAGGERGRGYARLDADRGGEVLAALVERYLGSEPTPFTRWLLGRPVEEVAIRLEVDRLTSWDFGERMGS